MAVFVAESLIVSLRACLARPAIARSPFQRVAAAVIVALAMFATAPDARADAAVIRKYELQKQGSGYRLVATTAPRPKAKADEVLVRVRAVSLNRRDIMVLNGTYGAGDVSGRIPLSDGAGEVIAVGERVTRFKPGDRVAGTFFTRWIEGKATPDALSSARGGDVDGMLAEAIVAHEASLVHIPEHLSFEEAATLPCAGLTAWNALFTRGKLQPGDFVLLEGTDGVSMFGLQFAVAADARAIITSSSDSKLTRARALGAHGAINYVSNPDWHLEVRELTGGTGVDHVLEVGGRDTLPKALASLAIGGHVALIGGLSGFDAQVPVGALMGRTAAVSGIYVGSRADFEAMNAFIAEHKLRPVIDRTFAFEDAAAAYEYMDSGSHFGKVVITL